MDITEIILNDHHDQRRMFALLDEMHTAEQGHATAVWERLRILLEVHAKAEELLFYPVLLTLGTDTSANGSPGEETKDAIHDHNEIRDAIQDVAAHDPGSDPWWSAIANVNKVNGDHMAEEEREGLTDFRRHVCLDERHTIAVAFCAFEAAHAAGIEPYDVDPEDYVKDRQ
ncbi:hemerythrin domain-containing protein [Arthrobacter sp. A5]|uniref:hemerythrin domain-containing protein n=1 Tax=Arthrobacter sp. A5 TaxID=576926 RepID=UPI003DA96E2B